MTATAMPYQLYLLYRKDPAPPGTYESAVVCASSVEEAKYIPLVSGAYFTESSYPTWVAPSEVLVRHLGAAGPSCQKGLILSSFRPV